MARAPLGEARPAGLAGPFGVAEAWPVLYTWGTIQTIFGAIMTTSEKPVVLEIFSDYV